MKKVITGNRAVAYGAKLSRVQVIAAYPITPQTTIIEYLADLCASGELKAEFIKVESEHSALAACVGASVTGARTFTATSGQGLLLMHEIIHWAAGARLPVVMAVVNRAIAPGWNIWTEQNDTLSQRDTGWMQFYTESNQEVLDTVIQAYKVAERVSLPAMVILDAFVLSHTSEIVDIPPQEMVDEYLPPYQPQYKLDVDDPKAFGGLVYPADWTELRYKIQQAHQQAIEVAREADREYGELFGRSYGLVEKYPQDEAEVILVTSGTVTSTARDVIDHWRARGQKVSLLKVRLFRPFPVEDLRRALEGAEKVAVIDRNFSFGHGGIFAQEIKSALYMNSHRPTLFSFIAGLGGRDITPATVEKVLNYTVSRDRPEEEAIWIDLKK
ncbi:MAG: pyruvate ferredoxin oxidoreductase [Anaerolineae bacterium]|nr:pyruvate ferredoxin oxidoreductase [Anaerolineae bacterium]MDW8102054.1 pyruvate ferredoxin oxidoreductase [Anaerolineae bacterium]